MNTVSRSISETIDLGVRLGRKLKKGDCVALIGGLGSGKTVFTKGIAKGLGVRGARYVNSPTFVIIKEYSAGGGSAKGGKGKMPLYHFDLYRLDHYSALDGMNYMEYFYGDGVTVIEWADKIRELLPKKYIEVNLGIVDSNRRKIIINKRT